MTIDESIAHAKEVAESNRRKVENDCVTGRTHLHPFCDCIKCAEEHEQLAEWLEELKRLRSENKALKDRQTPKRPDVEGDGYADGHLVYDTWICPNCNERYEIDYDNYDYCPNCGQHIDHSELTEDD